MTRTNERLAGGWVANLIQRQLDCAPTGQSPKLIGEHTDTDCEDPDGGTFSPACIVKVGFISYAFQDIFKAHSTCNCPKHEDDNDVDDENSVLKLVALID